MNFRIEKIYNRLLKNLLDLYDGEEEEIKFLFDVEIKRCNIAERDHMRESRVYSHVGCSNMTICMSSSIDLLSDENIRGIILHEIGHLIHVNYPDTVEGIEILEDLEDAEIIADAIIDQVFGIHIFYDERKTQWIP